MVIDVIKEGSLYEGPLFIHGIEWSGVTCSEYRQKNKWIDDQFLDFFLVCSLGKVVLYFMYIFIVTFLSICQALADLLMSGYNNR